MQIAIFVALGVLGLLCLVGTALGLPGHWVLLLLAIGIEVGDEKWLPTGQDTTFGWGLIVAILVLGLIGEAIEFGAASFGAKKGGGSRRGAWGGLLGGLAGGLLGIAIPIPILGSLIGAFLGTFAGTLIGESTGKAPKLTKDSLKPALWATLARAGGTAAKLAITLSSLILLLGIPALRGLLNT